MDLDAEAAVLSALILNPTVVYDLVCGIITTEMFYSESNKRIHEAIVTLTEAATPVDSVTVASWLQSQGRLAQVGGTPYIAQITEGTPAVANVAAHASIVRDRWHARRLIIECQRYAAEAFVAPGGSAIQLVQQAEASLAELSSHGVGAELEHVGVILDREVALIQELRDRGQLNHGTGTPTGFERMDQLTGGLFGSDLGIIAARPGVGKSSLAGNLAANVARPPTRGGVAFFSLEMPAVQVAIRFVCAEQSIRLTAVRKNSLDRAEWELFQSAAKDIATFPVWIDDSATLTLFDVRARVRKLQRELALGKNSLCSSLKLVVIDYLQLMKGQRERGDTREAEVASLSRGLKALAKDCDLPVVALSQLNRGVEQKSKKDRRPVLSDLRESGAIEQDADWVWFIYRPDYYDENAKKGEAEVIVAKQRQGPPGTVKMHFKGDCMRFYERAEQNYDDLTEDFAEDR
jgi:replicative DNA helicase